jgi:phosphoribosylamine-glycine ligase
MNILLIGSGGREHALAIALAKSPQAQKLFVAPGNPGTAAIAQNVALDVADFDAVIDFCRVQNIGFVVIGPEQPLVEGMVDALEAAGIKAFGPSKSAARLEGSPRIFAPNTISPPAPIGASPPASPPSPICANRARRLLSRPMGSPPARVWSSR